MELQVYLQELKHIILVLDPYASVDEITDIDMLVLTAKELTDNSDNISNEMALYIMGRINFIEEKLNDLRPKKLHMVRYRKPVSVRVIPDSKMNDLHNSIIKHLDYNESRRAAGRNAAGNYISD